MGNATISSSEGKHGRRLTHIGVACKEKIGGWWKYSCSRFMPLKSLYDRFNSIRLMQLLRLIGISQNRNCKKHQASHVTEIAKWFCKLPFKRTMRKLISLYTAWCLRRGCNGQVVLRKINLFNLIHFAKTNWIKPFSKLLERFKNILPIPDISLGILNC